jgi:hypothetical protein
MHCFDDGAAVFAKFEAQKKPASDLPLAISQYEQTTKI